MVGGNAKWCSRFGRRCGNILNSYDVYLVCDLVVFFLSIYLREIEIFISLKIGM